MSARRGVGTSVSAEEPSDSRRADNSLGAGDPVAHFYALTDTQLAAACRIPYERVEGRVVSWNTGTGLATSAVSAATELGVSAQHTRDLIAWMASFQLRPTVGGAVLAAHTDERNEQGLSESSQAISRARDDEDDDQIRYSPADSYNEAGDLRVYTQPLRSDGRPKNWSGATPRHAIHDAVDARVASCMDLGTDGTSYETLAAFVTYQHDDGTCTVRLADDLLTVITRVHVQPSRDPVDADTRDRLLEHVRDMHDVAVLYTERGARVLRRGSHRMYGKRYSMDVTGDQRAGLHEAVETVMEVVGRQLGAQPTGFAEGIEYEGCQVRAGWAAVRERGMRGLCRLGTTLSCGEVRRRLPTTGPTKGVGASLAPSAG